MTGAGSNRRFKPWLGLRAVSQTTFLPVAWHQKDPPQRWCVAV